MQLRLSPNGHCVALCSVHHSNIIHVLSASEAGVCPQSWRLQHPQPVISFQFDPNPHPYPNDLVLMTLCTDGVVRFWRLSSPHLPAFPLTNPALHWFIGHEMNTHGAGNDYVGAAWLSYFERRYELLSATKFLDPSARVLTINRSGHVTLWHIKHLYERPRTNPQAIPIITLPGAVGAHSEIESFLLSFCPTTSFSPKTGIADLDCDDDSSDANANANSDVSSGALVPAQAAGAGQAPATASAALTSQHHFSWLSLLRMRLYALTSNHTIRHWVFTHHSLMPHPPKLLPAASPTGARPQSPAPFTPAAIFSRDFKFALVASIGGHRWVQSHQNV
jgi:hypothetical protein